MEEEYEDYIDDDLDIDLSEDLDDDEILISEDESMDLLNDENFIYEKLERRKSPFLKNVIDNSLTGEIVNQESGGDYRAINPNSSAVGKYQFLWDTWKDKIKEVTGVKDKESFRNNPEAQDYFYNYYVEKEMIPAVSDLKKIAPNLSVNQLAKLYHYQGKEGAIKYLKGGVDKPQSYNKSISEYTGIKRQQGGTVNIPTNFKMPNINMNYPLALNNNSFIEEESEIPETLLKGVKVLQEVKKNISDGLSDGIDMAEQFTSQITNNEQLRRNLKLLYEDKMSNYVPVNQIVNNNPII